MTTKDKSKDAVTPRNGRTARFAMHDPVFAGLPIFRLHGRGGSKSKYAHLDDYNEREIARRNRSENPEDWVETPIPVDYEIEFHDPEICKTEHEKVSMTVKVVYPVGVAEETLLLVLLSLAARRRHDPDRQSGVVDSDSSTRDLAVQAIGAKGVGPLSERILQINVTRRRLVSELGLSGGSGYEYLKARLRRLRWIGYDATILSGNSERAWGGSQLISYDIAEDDPDAFIQIRLNERFARILVGKSADGKTRPRYERINLDERFALSNEAAKLLHTRLSIEVRDQKSRKRRFGPSSITYEIDALAKLVYPPHRTGKPLPESTIRDRRQAIKEGLTEIAKLPGWNVEFLKPAKVPGQRLGVRAVVSRNEPKKRAMAARKSLILWGTGGFLADGSPSYSMTRATIE